MIKSIPFPYLTVYEVARAANLSVPGIYKHIEFGHLDAIKVQGFRQYMIEPAALTAFLKGRLKGQFVRPPKRVKAYSSTKKVEEANLNPEGFKL